MSSAGQEKLGISEAGTVYWNLPPARLIELAVQRGKAALAAQGPLVCTTGPHANRSPQERFVVSDHGIVEDGWEKIDALLVKARNRWAAGLDFVRVAGCAGVDARSHSEAEVAGRFLEARLSGVPRNGLIALQDALFQSAADGIRATSRAVSYRTPRAGGCSPGTTKPGRARGRTRPTDRYMVFLSHSTLDSFVARAVAREIRELGAEVWLDAWDLHGGDPLKRGIVDGVTGCDEAVVLLSSYTLQSPWIFFETGLICGQEKRLTPLLNNVDVEGVPLFRDLKAVDLNHLDQYLAELRSRVERAPGCH